MYILVNLPLNSLQHSQNIGHLIKILQSHIICNVGQVNKEKHHTQILTTAYSSDEHHHHLQDKIVSILSESEMQMLKKNKQPFIISPSPKSGDKNNIYRI